MKIYTTAPLEDPRDARRAFPRLERAGYDGAFSFEAKHDPFLPLALAAEHTERLRLGTAIAIAFARNPMNLANLAYGLQVISEGRFVLGLGSQIKPHVEKRFSATWSRPAARMRELVLAIRAIFAAWEGEAPLDFRGEMYTHTLMPPAFDPGPNPYGPPPIFTAGVMPVMTRVGGEVADGFFVHPFNSRESIERYTLPFLLEGLAKSGRKREDLEVVVVTMVATPAEGQDFGEVRRAVKKQLAFYGSTPAYKPILDCHGWGEAHHDLNALSKRGEWDAMADRITDEMLETLCIVREDRGEVAAAILEKVDGLADSVSLTNNRAPDPLHWSDCVGQLKALVAG